MAKRCANGEGSIRKRKDGRWEGRYTAGRDPVTGKAIDKNVLDKTQAEVKEKLKAAIVENVNLDIARAEQYTVGQWMDVWFENCAKIKVRPSSHQTYRGYIDNHIKPNIGNIPLRKLSSLHLQQFYKKLLTGGRVERTEAKNQPKGLSAKTVRYINQVISSAMDFAKEQKMIYACFLLGFCQLLGRQIQENSIDGQATNGTPNLTQSIVEKFAAFFLVCITDARGKATELLPEHGIVVSPLAENRSVFYSKFADAPILPGLHLHRREER